MKADLPLRVMLIKGQGKEDLGGYTLQAEAGDVFKAKARVILRMPNQAAAGSAGGFKPRQPVVDQR